MNTPSSTEKTKGFTIYHEGDDAEVFEDTAGNKQKNEFVFTGFGNGIHPYHKRQMDWIIIMLASGGVFLNLKEVPTVNDIGKNTDSGEFEMEDLYLPKDLKPSSDGKSYLLIQDTEMGRGWGVLLYVKNGSGQIINQDHRDNIRDELLEGEWIRSLGVDYKKKCVKDLSKIK